MNGKYFLSVFIILIFAGSVFAVNSTCEINGLNFTVPGDFKLNESSNDTCIFINDDGELLSVNAQQRQRSDLIVSDYLPCDVEYFKKTVNNHTGIMWTMENDTYFTYFDDDYVITLQASNSRYIEMIS